MDQLGRRTTGVVLSALVLATVLTGCSTKKKSVANLPPSANAAAGNSTGNGASAAAAGSKAGAAGSAAAGGGGAVLGDNPGCHLLPASDVKAAAGKDLPAMTGNVGGGMQGNTGHQSCLYTADQTGHGADVDVEINTFASGAKDQLATMNTNQKDQVDSQNQIAAGSAVLKDVSVGDQGFEVDVHATGANDESVWFVKGDKVVNVEVNSGVAGSALTLAKEVAGKI
jgi:hypothetical protein